MKPIRNRDELIALIAENAPTKACVRAIKEDGATVCGGFKSPAGLNGWIVQIKAKHGSQWIIAVYCDETAHRYSIRRLKRVPWLRWLGQSTGRRLIDGDVPRLAAYLKMQARRNHDKHSQNAADGAGAEVPARPLQLQGESRHGLQLDNEGTEK